jgi:hypothetical protein
MGRIPGFSKHLKKSPAGDRATRGEKFSVNILTENYQNFNNIPIDGRRASSVNPDDWTSFVDLDHVISVDGDIHGGDFGSDERWATR